MLKVKKEVEVFGYSQFFMVIYLEVRRIRYSWNFIHIITRQVNLLWCLMGDFNDILHDEERKGRAI